MPNVAFRGADYPLLYKTTGGSPDPKWFYLSRIQDFSAQKNQAAQPVYEIGTPGQIGATADAARHSGSISWIPYSMSIFKVLAGLTPNDVGTTVTLTDIMNSSGIELHGASRGISGAVAQSININIAVQQAATASAQFRGTGYLAGATLTTLEEIVTAGLEDIYHEDGTTKRHDFTTPANSVLALIGASYSSYLADEITIELASAPGTPLLRAQRVSIQAGFTIDETEEQGYDGVVSTDSNSPTATVTIDFLDGDSTPDAAIPFDTPDDLVINFGTDFDIVVDGVFSNVEGIRSQVRGYATRQYSYLVKEANVTGGITFTSA